MPEEIVPAIPVDGTQVNAGVAPEPQPLAQNEEVQAIVDNIIKHLHQIVITHTNYLYAQRANSIAVAAGTLSPASAAANLESCKAADVEAFENCFQLIPAFLKAGGLSVGTANQAVAVAFKEAEYQLKTQDALLQQLDYAAGIPERNNFEGNGEDQAGGLLSRLNEIMQFIE